MNGFNKCNTNCATFFSSFSLQLYNFLCEGIKTKIKQEDIMCIKDVQKFFISVFEWYADDSYEIVVVQFHVRSIAIFLLGFVVPLYDKLLNIYLFTYNWIVFRCSDTSDHFKGMSVFMPKNIYGAIWAHVCPSQAKAAAVLITFIVRTVWMWKPIYFPDIFHVFCVFHCINGLFVLNVHR